MFLWVAVMHTGNLKMQTACTLNVLQRIKAESSSKDRDKVYRQLLISWCRTFLETLIRHLCRDGSAKAFGLTLHQRLMII